MNAYEGLPDISEVVPRSDADDALFCELSEVLKKYGARNRFGISLLHTHFPIAADEILCELTDEAARVQTISPIKSGRTNAIETQWRLDEGGACHMICICSGPNTQNHDHVSRGG